MLSFEISVNDPIKKPIWHVVYPSDKQNHELISTCKCNPNIEHYDLYAIVRHNKYHYIQLKLF